MLVLVDRRENDGSRASSDPRAIERSPPQGGPLPFSQDVTAAVSWASPRPAKRAPAADPSQCRGVAGTRPAGVKASTSQAPGAVPTPDAVTEWRRELTLQLRGELPLLGYPRDGVASDAAEGKMDLLWGGASQEAITLTRLRSGRRPASARTALQSAHWADLVQNELP